MNELESRYHSVNLEYLNLLKNNYFHSVILKEFDVC